MATRDAVERRLWARAQLRAADLGFAPDCEVHVRQMAEDAARTLERQGFLTDPDRLAAAEQNVDIFIREMIEEARAQGLDQLHETTYHAARSKLCPLWPIC